MVFGFLLLQYFGCLGMGGGGGGGKIGLSLRRVMMKNKKTKLACFFHSREVLLPTTITVCLALMWGKNVCCSESFDTTTKELQKLVVLQAKAGLHVSCRARVRSCGERITVMLIDKSYYKSGSQPALTSSQTRHINYGDDYYSSQTISPDSSVAR